MIPWAHVSLRQRGQLVRSREIWWYYGHVVVDGLRSIYELHVGLV